MYSKIQTSKDTIQKLELLIGSFKCYKNKSDKYTIQIKKTIKEKREENL